MLPILYEQTEQKKTSKKQQLFIVIGHDGRNYHRRVRLDVDGGGWV